MNGIIESLNGLGTRFADFALPMFFQSAALIVVLFVFDLLLRNKVRATYRYAVWMLVLIKLILPPSLALPTSAAYWIPANPKSLYSFPVSLETLPSATVAVDIYENPARPTPISASNSAKNVPTTQTILFVTWLINVVAMAIFVFWQMRNVARTIQQSTKGPETAQSLLNSCRQQLGIRTPIQVRCAAIGNPAICGVFRPVILIPAGLATNLNSLELRSVLLHELAHLMRGDLWVNHAQILLQIFYWYNPLLWLANATIRRAREAATDEMVLVAMGGDAPAYPMALLRVAKLGLNRPFAALGLLGILEPGRGLTERIKSIASRPIPLTARFGKRGVIAVALGALIALPMARRIQAEPPSQPLGRSSAQTNSLKAIARVSAVSDWAGKRFYEPIGLPKLLTPTDVDALNSKLESDPEDFEARRDLILNFNILSEERIQNVLWVIEHHPEFSGGPPMQIDPINHPLDYGKGKSLWLQHVKDHPTNAKILENAAEYFIIYDNATAEDLLKKALVVEPSNPKWSEKLGQLYQLESIGKSGTANAAKALAEFEKARAQNPSFERGGPLVMDLAKAAMAAGDLPKARKYAKELLGPGLKWSGGGNGGNAFFCGNTILGRVALREGNIEEAKRLLLLAGTSTGSPTLTSFGPNMMLAKELLEKGETNAPIAYFLECRQFWTFAANEKLDAWTKDVKEGRIPDFGANLNY